MSYAIKKSSLFKFEKTDHKIFYVMFPECERSEIINLKKKSFQIFIQSTSGDTIQLINKSAYATFLIPVEKSGKQFTEKVFIGSKPKIDVFDSAISIFFDDIYEVRSDFNFFTSKIENSPEFERMTKALVTKINL
jgi:hypothetical protein